MLKRDAGEQIGNGGFRVIASDAKDNKIERIGLARIDRVKKLFSGRNLIQTSFMRREQHLPRKICHAINPVFCHC